VGGAVLLGGIVFGVWAATREGPPPPKPTPATTASPPTVAAKTPPTEAKKPTADEVYAWLCGGVWSRTADDPVLGGKRTVRLTFLPDKTLVVKQSIPDLLGGLTGEAPGKDRDLAASMRVKVELLPDNKTLRFETTDPSLLGAGFKTFRLRADEAGGIFLTETGDESRFQPTPYTRAKE
jgi:hypothetical protein